MKTEKRKINPTLMKEWNYEKNCDIEISYGSRKKVWWICENNHEWEASPNNRSKGTSCPYCSGKLPTKHNNLLNNYPELCKEWDYTKNKLDPSKYKPKSQKNVWWVCKKGHSWKGTIYSRSSLNYKCLYCSGRKVCEDNNLLFNCPELCKEWNYDKNIIDPSEVIYSSNKNFWWICENNHEWKATPSNRNKGTSCPYCANKKVCKDNCLKTINPSLSREWNKRNDLRPENVVPYSNKKVWWICKNNHEWKAAICERSLGCGCPYCSNKKVCEDNNLLNNYPELCKEWSCKNKITSSQVTKGSGKKVWWICKNNHEWKATVNSRTQGNGCPYCSSNISNSCINWLKTKNITDTEYKIIINKKIYYADGFNKNNNTVYEYLGTFWHGDPRKYDPQDINKKCKKTYIELLSKTILKFNNLISNGFNLIYCWEDENINKKYSNVILIDILKEAAKIHKTKKNIDILNGSRSIL